MKNVIVVVIILFLCLCLGLCFFACGMKDWQVGLGSGDTGSQRVRKEDFYGTKEYSEPDFTDLSDFKVEKSEEVANISYDSIFLRGGNNAQLDLCFEDGTKGTLMVSKVESFVIDDSATTSSIEGTEVTYVESIDGYKHYTWVKDNIYYEFLTLENFSTEVIAKIIKGYTVVVGS